MPYWVKLVKWPIESGSEVSWLSLTSSLSKSDANRNQMRKKTYSINSVSKPIKSGREVSWLLPSQSLSKKAMRIEIKYQNKLHTLSSSSDNQYTPVRSSADCGREKAYKKDWGESKVNEISNWTPYLLGQVSKVANTIRYWSQLVVVNVESIKGAMRIKFK